MNDALYAAASGMNAVARMVDAAARNAVNARTPGYRARVLAETSFTTSLDEELGRESTLVQASSHTSFQQGMLVQSGSPTSVALQGPGFLAVQGPSGVHYTRSGDLSISATGQLQTRGGYPVLTDSGTVQLNKSGVTPTIDEQGQILQGSTVVGKLRLVEFGKPEHLNRSGETFFSAPPEADAHEAKNTSIRPGMLEMPSESSMISMVKMISANRNFEAAQRTIATINRTYQRLVR